MATGDQTKVSKPGVPAQITREDLPNATAFKYILPSNTLGRRQAVFTRSQLNKAQDLSPRLAAKLFQAYPVITRVALGTTEKDQDFITVTVAKKEDWQAFRGLMEDYLVDIASYLTQGGNIQNLIDLNRMGQSRDYKAWVQHFMQFDDLPFDEIEQRAVIALVNAQMADHGGEIHHAGYHEDTKVLDLWLEGACAGCPSSEQTVKGRLMSIFKSVGLGKPVEAVHPLPVRPANLRVLLQAS